MRGTYNLSGNAMTLAGAVTLAFINVGVNCSLRFLRFAANQKGVTASAQQTVQIVTQVTAFPTVVSATPRPSSLIDQASKITGNTTGAAGTCGVNASAEGAGTKTVYWADTFNVLTGWVYTPTPNEVIELSASGTSGLGVYFPDAPGTLTGWSVDITFQEV